MADMGEPFPKMIEHPDVLTGTVMDDKGLNMAFPGRKHVMLAIREECKKGDFGYVFYGGGEHWKVSCAFAVERMGWVISACIPCPKGEEPAGASAMELQELKKRHQRLKKWLASVEKTKIECAKLEAQIKALEEKQATGE